MPRRPETHAKLDAVHEAWELFDHEEMIERLLKQTEYIDFERDVYKRQVLEWMMELTASLMSAVSSMMTGVLPAPTPSAGLPEE